MSTAPVYRATRWANNAELIADVRRLGYITDDSYTLDPTYGLGVWWRTWRPHRLEASDLDPAKSPTGTPVDFTDLPWDDHTFDVVCFDPPYKLNGTPDPIEARYGVHEVRTWQQRHELIAHGLTETARTLRARGTYLLKVQDQVCSGKIRWQTRIFADQAEQHCGLELIDRFDMLGGRPQPADRRQAHVHANYSTLLVFRKCA